MSFDLSTNHREWKRVICEDRRPNKSNCDHWLFLGEENHGEQCVLRFSRGGFERRLLATPGANPSLIKGRYYDMRLLEDSP
jgi:hypothetical protein